MEKTAKNKQHCQQSVIAFKKYLDKAKRPEIILKTDNQPLFLTCQLTFEFYNRIGTEGTFFIFQIIY